MSEALCKVTSQCNLQLDSGGILSDGSIPTQVALIHDQCVDKSKHYVLQTIVRMIDAAEHTLLIESPYPAFGKEMRDAIRRAARRNVQVTILTNSLASTDQTNVYAAYQNQKRGLLRDGICLREFRGPKILHAKTMIVDHRLGLIGSYNFDARSDNLNIELCIAFDDVEAATMLRSDVGKRMSQSDCVDSASPTNSVTRNAKLMKKLHTAMKRSYVELIRGWL